MAAKMKRKIRKDGRQRVAKLESCFADVAAARRRVDNKFSSWQEACSLPGVSLQSWLGRLLNGNVACVVCQRYSKLGTKCPLAATEGKAITKWLRLQNLKSHALHSDHKACVAAYLRDDDKSSVRQVASSKDDFKKVLQWVRTKKLPSSASFGKRNKLRK